MIASSSLQIRLYLPSCLCPVTGHGNQWPMSIFHELIKHGVCCSKALTFLFELIIYNYVAGSTQNRKLRVVFLSPEICLKAGEHKLCCCGNYASMVNSWHVNPMFRLNCNLVATQCTVI